MEIIKDCKVCFFSYDTEKHAPRSLPCGHTLCSQCLANILTSPNLRRCPFDNHAFTDSQTSVDFFPLNYVLLEFLEQTHGDICQIHFGEKLKFLCLTDERKLCHECAKNEEHKGHTIKKIKGLKAQGAKMKDELESILLEIRKFEEIKDDICEIIRKKFIRTIVEQFKEIKDIMVDKQFELVSYVNNIFSADKQKGSKNIFTLKQQLNETIKDIRYACENDNGDLILIENTLNSDHNVAKMLPQILEKKSLEMHDKIFKMRKSLEKSLNHSKEVVSALQLSSEEVVKEIYSVKEETELSEIYQKLQTLKFVSHFDVKKTGENLEISIWPDQPRAVEVKNEDFKAVETINIKLGRYDLLMREEAPNLLTYIFRSRLEKLTSLEISFDSKDFNRYSISWLANIICDSVQSLKSLSLNFEKCSVFGDPIRNLCIFVFSRMRNLKELSLYLNSSQIDNFDLEELASSLKPFCKNFERFALGLADNDLTDDEILRVFQMIQSMDGLKNFQLNLSGTEVTDKSLEIIGDNVLTHLKALDSFALNLSQCQISDRGIVQVLKNLRRLKNLELDLSHTQITNKTANVLSGDLMPRLKNSLESLIFIAKNTRVSKKNWKIHSVFEPITNIWDYFSRCLDEEEM